jgi:aspartyl-tRNA(Asn)/glutamyl-tRNA(Gln) amidotransferase subunit C
MTISRDQVEHIAELAKLELTDAEVDIYAEQLSDILAYVEQLNQLDTSAIPPTASVLPLSNVVRADEAQPSLPTEVALANAPDAAANQFRVSAVLDEDSP